MKRRTILTVILVLCCLLGACGTSEMPISVDEEISYFDNFVVSDGCVYLYCSIFLKNNSEKSYEVVLNGIFEGDCASGLLTEEKLIAVMADDTTNHVLTVPPGGGQFDVVFIGNHGGHPAKHDRLLPELEIVFAK